MASVSSSPSASLPVTIQRYDHSPYRSKESRQKVRGERINRATVGMNRYKETTHTVRVKGGFAEKEIDTKHHRRVKEKAG